MPPAPKEPTFASPEAADAEELPVAPRIGPRRRVRDGRGSTHIRDERRYSIVTHYDGFGRLS